MQPGPRRHTASQSDVGHLAVMVPVVSCWVTVRRVGCAAKTDAMVPKRPDGTVVPQTAAVSRLPPAKAKAESNFKTVDHEARMKININILLISI